MTKTRQIQSPLVRATLNLPYFLFNTSLLVKEIKDYLPKLIILLCHFIPIVRADKIGFLLICNEHFLLTTGSKLGEERILVLHCIRGVVGIMTLTLYSEEGYILSMRECGGKLGKMIIQIITACLKMKIVRDFYSILQTKPFGPQVILDF